MANGVAPTTQEDASKRLKGLLAKIEEKVPQESKEIIQLVTDIEDKNLAILGQDEVFKLRDSSGEIRAFRSVLHLAATNGTLIQPVPKGPFVISAQGYEQWEEAAAAITMKPPDIWVYGEKKSNPYMERENGHLIAIHCRTVAFRFTNKGIPQVSDWIEIFNLPKYRLIDLLAKAKNCPQAFRLLPVGQKPPEDSFTARVGQYDAEEEKRKFHDEDIVPAWASYSFDESTNFWVCTSHPEALTWYSQILNREKKAIHFAQTFSKRNALKHLSGLQRVPGQDKEAGKTNPINHWDVSVTAWRPTVGSIVKWDLTTYSNVARALAEAGTGKQDGLLITRGTGFSDDDPETQHEIKQIEEAEEDTAAGSTTQGGESLPPTPPDDGAGDPGPGGALPLKEATKAPEPKADPSAERKAGMSAQDKLKILRKTEPEVYKQALEEEKIIDVTNESAAIWVIRKMDEISKRPKGKK